MLAAPQALQGDGTRPRHLPPQRCRYRHRAPPAPAAHCSHPANVTSLHVRPPRRHPITISLAQVSPGLIYAAAGVNILAGISIFAQPFHTEVRPPRVSHAC
jgi:hypothetical protein